MAIDDETLRRWKSLGKGPRGTDVLYVEPSENPVLKLGPIEIVGLHGVIVFAPSESAQLSFRLEEGDIGLVNCTASDRAGRQIIRVTDNRIRFDDSRQDFKYERVPGRFRLTGPANEVLDAWMIAGARTQDPAFGDDPAVVLEVEVTGLGRVSVCGIWTSGEKALIVRPEQWIVPRTSGAAMQVVGGAGSRINWLGPVDHSFFEHGFKGIL
jgi:hypothetical protein